MHCQKNRARVPGAKNSVGEYAFIVIGRATNGFLYSHYIESSVYFDFSNSVKNKRERNAKWSH
jgi:hypothetical protein